MSGVNTDYIQATIEIFGFFIIVVIAMVFGIITGNSKKSEKCLFTVLLLSGFSLVFDACWYLCNGNTSDITVVINWLSNLLIFLCNPVLVLVFNRYLFLTIQENDCKPNKIVRSIDHFLLIVAFAIPIANLTNDWMYYIDEGNIYHRMFGWYIYTALTSIAMIIDIVVVILYRKHLSRQRRITIYIFLMAPFVGIALQVTSIGISFIQIGTALGSFGILTSYLIEWIRNEKEDSDVTEDKKRLWVIEGIFAIVILFMSAAIISCLVSINKVSNKNSEQSSTALAYMVSETVERKLSEPVDVSRTMAESKAIIDALSLDKLEGTEEEEEMLSFMKRIKEEFGYQMIFVASEKTKAYYTYDGLSRYMDVDGDPKDAWYNEFKARGIQYELNIDEDKDNDMLLGVFVNIEVRDKNGNLIGVCGVGTSVESLLIILSQYENDYSLDITITDRDCIVQIDTDESIIGLRRPFKIKNKDGSGAIYYEKNNNSARLTKYMRNMDWYLIIEDSNPNKINIQEIILPSMIIYILGVLLMISFSLGFGILEKKRRKQLMASRLLSEFDRLTGVKNRNAFETFQKNISLIAIDEKLSIVMMDINGLKTVNDKLGHIAGDELIIGTTNCIKDTLGPYGEIYRVGGDEFVFISYEEEELIKEKLWELSREVDGWSGDLVNELAISVGMASSKEEPDKSFNELLKMADARMYADKNAYYRRTGKDRRMSW